MKVFLKDGRCEVDSRFMDLVIELTPDDITNLRALINAIDNEAEIPFEEKDKNSYMALGDCSVDDVVRIRELSKNNSHE